MLATVPPRGRCLPVQRVPTQFLLGVKPAFEDVNANGFLAFPFAKLKTKSSPTPCNRGSDEG